MVAGGSNLICFTTGRGSVFGSRPVPTGAFHRAHQAVFTELAAAATGREDWGIVGVTQRSASVRDQLMPQDGLYSVLERGADAAPLRVVGTIRDEYRGLVLTRFANPALRHRTVQVAMDGSQKLPVRLLGTVRDRLAAGTVPRYASLGVAAWMVYVAQGRDTRGRDLPLDDPMADRLRTATAGFGGDPRRLVDALLAVPEIFGADLPEQDGFRAALVDHVGRLMKG